MMSLHLSRRVLHQLRASLERDTGSHAATYLQQAGFAGGEELHAEFAAWLARTHGIEEPGTLDIRFLGDILGAFFAERGWGVLTTTPLGAAVLALDAPDWAEAVESGGSDFPSCHVTCGMLADFLGRIAGKPVAVMEVECRSRGDGRCRFLAGAPETLGTLYDRMARGMGYTEVLAAN